MDNSRKPRFNDRKYQTRKSEKKAAKKMTKWILSIVLAVIILIGIGTGAYVYSAMKPYDAKSNKEVRVEIPSGATNSQIAEILAKDKIIKNATVFNYWTKTKSVSNFLAGDFYLSPSMNFDQIVAQLQNGGKRKVTAQVLVREGITVDQVGDAIAKSTSFKKDDFLKLMKDDAFLKTLQKKYPKLLDSSMASKNVRYHLEGYLYPAKYDLYRSTTLKELVTQMVQKANDMYSPYFAEMKENNLTVQETLTLASLVEREGVTETDRKKIAGVFFNRLAVDMPLQSDISVMYALNTHKTTLSLKDVKVKSPYNLYVHTGFGPGPFNNPSIESVKAVLNPTDREKGYLYFVADLKTGEVYYNTTLDAHESQNKSLGQ